MFYDPRTRLWRPERRILRSRGMRMGGGGVIRQFLSSGDPYAGVDGSPAAPAGPAEYPNLFTSSSGGPAGSNNVNAPYGRRPPWKVSGVDYRSGIDRSLYPSNSNLVDPLNAGGTAASAAMLAVAPSATLSAGNQLSVTESGVTFQGFDFSLHNGVSLNLGGSNVTVKNNNFALGTANGPNSVGAGGSCISTDPSHQNITIIYNEFTGWSSSSVAGHVGVGTVSTNGFGNFVIQYNWIKNSYAESATIASNSTPWTLDFRFNLIENAGLGFWDGNTHGDWIQLQTASTMASVNMNFNVWLQTIPVTGPNTAQTQGITYSPEGTVNVANYNNNTIITLADTVMDAFIGFQLNFQQANQIQNNYMDPSGRFDIGSANGTALCGWNPGSTTGGTIINTGNVNLLTGAPYNTS